MTPRLQFSPRPLQCGERGCQNDREERQDTRNAAERFAPNKKTLALFFTTLSRIHSKLPEPATTSLHSASSQGTQLSFAMASQKGIQKRQHVVMFPFMAQGHLIPFLHLSKLLARRTGFTITIVNTPLNIQRLRSNVETEDDASDIRLAELPFCSADHGLPPHIENTDSLPPPLFVRFFEASETLQSQFELLLRRITEEDGRSLLCIIRDMFLGWTLDVAEKFGIPRIMFSTCGAYGTTLCYSMWTHLPHRHTQSDEFVIPDLPHVSLHISQLTMQMKLADGSDPCSLFINRQIARNLRSWGMLFNTFEELEHDTLQHIRQATGRPAWAVGPVLPSDYELRKNREATDEVGRACLRWLDSHPPSSVLYISFGSQNSISALQMKELAMGLEASQRPFLWVVRSPLGFPPSAEFSPEILPEGFEDRMREKKQGLLIRKWAPQLLILSHPSTGGFLSHCGWNSTLESLSRGVPIIGWPMAAEQFSNSKLLAEELRASVEMKRGIEGELRKEEVERVVRMLMEEGKGAELRNRAIRIREAARRAVCEGGGGSGGETEKGSSVRAIDDLIHGLLCNAEGMK